jgi:asparagine synthase (glutamine-hydrolysing)
MCGIIGFFNNENSRDLVVKGLNILKHRGSDGYGIATDSQNEFSKQLSFKVKDSKHALGHCLHSIVSFVPQPFCGHAKMAANCEIYNWQELASKLKIKAKNDAELLFRLLEKYSLHSVLDIIDGDYAFVYWMNNAVYLVRDIIGIKPLWYSYTNGFAVASEKKALEQLGYLDIYELNPRNIIRYEISTDKLTFISREFFSVAHELKESLPELKAELKIKLLQAITKRAPSKKFGLLFSGGVDSSLLALILKQLDKDFICYTAALDEPGMKEAEDLVYAKKVASELGLQHRIITIKLKDAEKYLKKVVPIIEDSNVVKVGVALTFFLACEAAKKDNLKVIFSGLGSEEIFAGYERHKHSTDINKECLSGLLKMYERDTYRDDVITMYHNLELRVPFLDTKLVEYALKIPARFKLKEGHNKYILRELAETIGLPKEYAWRKKRAAQYGSKLDRALGKLAKQHKYKNKSDYLRTFYPSRNLRLGALVSSGKDSLYAAYVMKNQTYSINCLITLKSQNPDSYMFHTPNVNLVELQAQAMQLPLIIEETKGEKEAELDDLRKALTNAQKEYKIEGIITGALYSTYQRDRIEKLCDELGLKIFSPLWHINQESELKELLAHNFEVVLSSVAAEGLDSTWLNKVMDLKMIEKLVNLHTKLGLNIAGEGGEYESLVLDCPLFTKKIKLIDWNLVEESKISAKLIVKKAELINK